MGHRRTKSASKLPPIAPQQHLKNSSSTKWLSWKYAVIPLCILSFGCHNLLQEKISILPGFKGFGWALALVEVFGVLIFSAFERGVKGERITAHQSPLSSYLGLTLCLLTSCSLSAMSLNWINYPTKVVFRSCKLIPTMLISRTVNNNHVSTGSLFAGVMVCAGLLSFGLADSRVLPNFSPIGIFLVLASTFADAFMPNFQERLFRQGVSRTELTFYSNLFTMIFLVIMLGVTGELAAVIRWASADSVATAHIAAYTVLSYVAISCHMQTVSVLGGIGAVLVGNFRKTLTVSLSFLLFPKPFTIMYAVGGMLTLSGLLLSVHLKQKGRTLKDSRLPSFTTDTSPVKPHSLHHIMQKHAADTYSHRCPTYTVFGDGERAIVA